MDQRQLQQLSGDVWCYPMNTDPHDVQPNIGVIRTDEQTVLIDAGNGARHAAAIKSAAYEAGFPPVQMVIYTHHHWDHVFGAAAFNAETVIAHIGCRERLQERVARDWSPNALRAEIEQQPALKARNEMVLASIDEWGSFRLCLPNIVFSGALTFYAGSTQIDLLHVGGAHAAESIVVRVGDVLFVGDSYYPTIVDRTPENDKLEVVMLESFLESGAQIFVDGHGSPRSREELRQMIDAEIERQIAAGQR